MNLSIQWLITSSPAKKMNARPKNELTDASVTKVPQRAINSPTTARSVCCVDVPPVTSFRAMQA